MTVIQQRGTNICCALSFYICTAALVAAVVALILIPSGAISLRQWNLAAMADVQDQFPYYVSIDPFSTGLDTVRFSISLPGYSFFDCGGMLQQVTQQRNTVSGNFVYFNDLYRNSVSLNNIQFDLEGTN